MEAAKDLGWKEIGCVIVDKKTPVDKLRAYVIKDNISFGENIQIGGSLTFTDLKDSKKWETNSSPPEERFDALKILHEQGVRTWASMEPVIFPEQSLEIMDIVHSYVDGFKIGKLNHFKKWEDKFDWADFLRRSVEKMRFYGKEFYIKEDLRAYQTEDIFLSESETDMDHMALKNTFPKNELLFSN